MNKDTVLPRQTFSNLAAKKQNAIIAAAVEEFSRQGYQKASINSMVKAASISKGSIYQYFNNKEALFYFVFDKFTYLVKKTVKEVQSEKKAGFFEKIRQVLLAGVKFIDQYPDYFQIYLKVLFEPDIPERSRLLSQVRLFSREYFGPLCEIGQRKKEIRQDVPLDVVIFILDATMDRFLQGYAQDYFDCGLDLKNKNKKELIEQIDMILQILQQGLKSN